MPLFTSKEANAKNQFLIYELAKMNERLRQKDLDAAITHDAQQTLKSFDFQWQNLAEGSNLPSDGAFMQQVQAQICAMTQLPPEWFRGKKVIDVGCGIGRFTFGLLSLGAEVTACDASISGLERTASLCQDYKNHLKLCHVNILKDKLPPESYDLAYSFGVVHHTGNTYLAIKNVCSTVKSSGRVFLMVYGYPEKHADFVELNAYEALRDELRPLTFEDRAQLLRKRFPADQVNGWFDATSPKINDLLKYGELVELLETFGFGEIQRTTTNRNLHVVGKKKAQNV